MKPSSLHALVIDRHFGELTPEAAELLDLHLTQDTAARVEADRILAALGVTRDAMYDHPELARVPVPSKVETQAATHRTITASWYARAAAVLLLASLTATGGYLAGRSSSSSVSAPIIAAAPVPAPVAAPHKASPWARYRMTFDASGSGMQVVRVDSPIPDKNSIQ